MSERVVKRTIEIMSEITKGDKSPDKVFSSYNIDERDYSRDLRDLKKIVKFWSEKIELVNTKALFEESSKRKLKQRQLDTKLAKAAEEYYYGPPHFGYDVHDGKPTPNRDFETLSFIMRSFLAGEPQFKIREKLYKERNIQIGRNRLHYILTDRFNRGKFVFMGKLFKGGWQLPITHEEFDDIQRRIPQKGGRLRRGYEWKDGKRVLGPRAKEEYQEVFKLRSQNYSMAEISKETQIPCGIVRCMLMDREVIGKIDINGKPLDEKTWHAVQAIKVPGYQKKLNEAKIVEAKISECMPCYRWQLREKVYFERESQKVFLKASSIDRIVRKMKSSRPPLIKERETDRLLQKAWEPFPKNPVETRHKGKSKKREIILGTLRDGESSLGEICLITGASRSLVLAYLQEFISEGLVEKSPNKYWLSQLGLTAAIKIPSTEGLSANERKLTRLLGMRKTENLRRILKHLQKQNETTIEIASGIKISERNVSAWLNLLKTQGIIEKTPPTLRGKWRVRDEWVEPIKKWLG